MKKRDLTIKERIRISNIVTIVVPVLLTTIIVFIFLFLIWIYGKYSLGIKFIDSQQFYNISQNIFSSIEEELENGYTGDYLDGLSAGVISTVEENQICIIVDIADENIATYGISTDIDNDLILALESLGGTGFVSNGSRELYMDICTVNEQTYVVSIFATCSDLSYNALKLVVLVFGLGLCISVFISVKLTNNFLIKFVFKQIEQSLDILSNGTNQIEKGNLSHTIEYEYNDEFKPVFDDFNNMAIRLKTSLETTKQHEKNRQEIFAGISHDLRTPLTSIRAYVEGLLEGIAKTPESRTKYLLTIKTKTEEIDQMISKIFLFSKLEMGDYPDNPELIKFDEFTQNYINSISLEYLNKGLKIELCHISKAKIYADSFHIKSIFTNIFENTLKYKEKETATIRVSLEKENNICYLSLADDGIGVEQENLSNLFDIFYRSDTSRHNPQKGSGLGLAIVKRSALRMGGNVKAFSEKGKGLEILITVPCKEAEHE